MAVKRRAEENSATDHGPDNRVLHALKLWVTSRYEGSLNVMFGEVFAVTIG